MPTLTDYINSQSCPDGCVAVADIDYSPTNPRKFFDPASLGELANNILAIGLIAPVVVRPIDGYRYELVAGERRHRAHVLAGLDWILADIRDLTDEQVRDIQIAENLQRQDPHPIEEANVFKSLLAGGMSEQEIADRYSKKVFFIRQRIRLTDLITPWQELFFKNLITLSDALSLSAIPSEQQIKLLDEKVGKSNEAQTGSIQFSMWDFKSQKPLNQAPFNITDGKLLRNIPPCTMCKYNTAVAALFPEDAAIPMCNNMDCFGNKVVKNVEKQVKRALKEEEQEAGVWQFVNFATLNNDTILQIREAGHKVLSVNTHFHEIKLPNIETEKSLLDSGYDPGEVETMAIMSEMDYNKAVDTLNKMKANGTAKKALIVGGTDLQLGKEIYIRIIATETAREAMQNGSATQEQLEAELKRVNELEARNKEKDQLVIYERLKDATKELYPDFSYNADFTVDEMVGTIITMVSHQVAQKWIIELLDPKSKSHYMNPAEMVERLKICSYEMLVYIFRYCTRLWTIKNLTHISDKSPFTVNAVVPALHGIVNHYLPVQVNIIITEQKDVTDKRLKRVDKRILAINEELKQFQADQAEPGEPSDINNAVKDLLEN